MAEKTFQEMMAEFNAIKSKVLDLQDQSADLARKAQEWRERAAAMVPKLQEAEKAEKAKEKPNG